MSYCKKAIAYVKEFLPENSEENVVELSESDSLVTRDLGNGILVTYLVDEGEYFSYVQNRHLVNEDISANDLHTIGIKNLAEKALGTVKIHEHSNIYTLILDGNYEASLLVIDILWDEYLSEYAPNGFVVAIPCRDVIAFCDKNSKNGIEELKQVNGRVFEGADHQLTDCLYQRENGRWERVLNA